MIIGDAVTKFEDGLYEQKTYCLIEGKLVVIRDRYNCEEELLDHEVVGISSDIPMTQERVKEIIREGLV